MPVHRFLLFGLALLVPSDTVAGQELPAEVKQVLEHRMGHWEVRNDVLGSDGTVARVTHEEHRSQFIINGEILEIEAHIDGHEDFRAFLLFNPSLNGYVYTTIDRTNNHVVMFADAASPYRFTSDPIALPDGTSLIFRLIFETVEQDQMHGFGEASTDGGATWRRVYDQHLRRLK